MTDLEVWIVSISAGVIALAIVGITLLVRVLLSDNEEKKK